MTLRDALRVLTKPSLPSPVEAKAVTGPFAANVETGTYLLGRAKTPQEMMRRAQAAYHRNPWVGTAEAAVTRRVTGLPWHLEDANDEEYDEPFPTGVKAAFDLLEKPQAALAPNMRDPGLLTRRSLVSITSRHMGLCGMSYWYLDSTDQYGIPAAILYVNPARVWPATTTTGRITGWIIDPSDEYGHGGTPLELGELLPFYLDPPDSGPYGTGLYERAVLKSQITNLADQHAAYLLGTGGRLAGIVSPKEGTIPDEQFKTLVSEFRTVNDAPDAAKRTTVVRGPIDFTSTAADPEKLALIEISRMNRDDIFTIWGVPPRMAGVEGTSVGLNSGETLKYEEAILMQGPVHDRVVAIRETIQFGLLDRWLASGTTIDLEIEEPEFDDREPLFDIAQKAVSIPLTNEERRDLIGLAPFGDTRDKEVWLPATYVVAYSSGTAAAEPTPQVTVSAPVSEGPPPEMMGKGRREFLGLRKTIDMRWVPAVKRSVSEILDAQRKAVAAKVRSSSADALKRHRKDGDYWFPGKPESDRLRKILAPTLAGIAQTVAERTDELLRKGEGKAFADEVVAQITTSVGSRIVGITETTRDAVAAAISQGFDDGLSPGQIGDLIESLPAFDEARAELVARTETMYAYNTAALSSYGSYGVREVEAIDGDQDEVCAARDGRTFPIDEAYGIQDHPNGTLDWVPVL